MDLRQDVSVKRGGFIIFTAFAVIFTLVLRLVALYYFLQAENPVPNGNMFNGASQFLSGVFTFGVSMLLAFFGLLAGLVGYLKAKSRAMKNYSLIVITLLGLAVASFGLF